MTNSEGGGQHLQHREQEPNSESGEGPGIMLEWKAHPFLENWKRSVFAICMLFLTWIGVYIASEGSVILTCLAIVVMMGTLGPFFFVTSYRCDEEGVTQRRGKVTIRKKWEELRNYHIGRTYVQLSPFVYQSRLEAFRSLTLLTRKDNHDEVVALVKERIKKFDMDD